MPDSGSFTEASRFAGEVHFQEYVSAGCVSSEESWLGENMLVDFKVSLSISHRLLLSPRS